MFADLVSVSAHYCSFGHKSHENISSNHTELDQAKQNRLGSPLTTFNLYTDKFQVLIQINTIDPRYLELVISNYRLSRRENLILVIEI